MEGTAAPHTDIPGVPDLTGQIFGTINNYVAAGGFGSVYQCDWRRSTLSPVKVAVKVIRCFTPEQDKVLRRLRREAGIWAHLIHENIVPFYGITKDFGPFPALVSLWFSHGTLHRLIADKGTSLSVRSKLNLLHDIACGLHYLHSFPIVHGDLTSSNVLVDIKGGEYNACLIDFGLSTVLNEMEESTATVARHGAVRWTAPELFLDDIKHTDQSDMYSFGCVMFHVLTLLIPWSDLNHLQVVLRVTMGEEIKRPQTLRATSDLTDTRWNEIKLCLSVDTSARPSASMVMAFLKNELLALTDDDVTVGREQESRQSLSLGTGLRDIGGTAALSAPRCSSPIVIQLEDTGSPNSYMLHETDERTLPSSSAASSLQPQVNRTTIPPISQSFSQPTPRQLNSSSTPVRSPSPLDSYSTPFQLPKQFHRPSNPVALHPSATVSSLSVSGPLNVLIFGATGVGKSSVINLILGRELAQTSSGAQTCTMEHSLYGVSLENYHFKLWEVSSVAPMGLFRRLFVKWNLKRKYKRLHRDDGVYLLLYCMRDSRVQETLARDYSFFTSIIGSTAGHVPVAAVVTCLEDYPSDMDDWWKKNEEILKESGMQFSKHACITSLPDDPAGSPALRSRRQRSAQVIRELLCDSYQSGRASLS